jgi:phosphoribosylglycinamide formyltransferase-1
VKSLVILISGRGSNLQAIVEAKLPARIAAVISNNADIPGLEFAQRHGIHTEVVNHRDYPSRDAFDRALMQSVDRHAPDLVILAGFMRVLTDGFVTHYAGRMINIHPSLLPAFPGLSTHQRALEAGVKIHGCTVHFVTPTVDHGPIIVQAAVPVNLNDTPQTLAARVLEQEHRVFPQAIRWFLEDRLSIDAGGTVSLAGAVALNSALRSPSEES